MVKWALIAALAVGAVLLIIGLVGRRVGGDPRCRKCGYGWTGLTAQNCPECGRAATEWNTVYGRRVRRRGWIALGSVLTLVAGAILTGPAVTSLHNLDLYTLYPDAWLVRFASGDDARALAEIVHRLDDGSLGGGFAVELAPLALHMHAEETDSPNWAAWADVLALLMKTGSLSQEDAEQFVNQSVSIQVKLRPQVREDMPVVGLVERRSRGSRLWPGALLGSLEPAPDSDWSGGATFACFTDPGRFQSSSDILVEGLSPGHHRLDWVGTLDGGPLGKRRNWSMPISVSAEVEIVPLTEPDPVQLVDAPDLREKIAAAISIEKVRLRRANKSADDLLVVELTITDPLPIDVSFDAIAIAGSVEIALDGFASCNRDGPWNFRLKGTVADSHEIGTIDLILSASREPAWTTMDCFEVWRGELRFDGIDVDRRQ